MDAEANVIGYNSEAWRRAKHWDESPTQSVGGLKSRSLHTFGETLVLATDLGCAVAFTSHVEYCPTVVMTGALNCLRNGCNGMFA